MNYESDLVNSLGMYLIDSLPNWIGVVMGTTASGEDEEVYITCSPVLEQEDEPGLYRSNFELLAVSDSQNGLYSCVGEVRQALLAGVNGVNSKLSGIDSELKISNQLKITDGDDVSEGGIFGFRLQIPIILEKKGE